MGATGLHNLGNSCYMASTLQCLSHIPQLTSVFLDNEYRRYLNETNALGTKVGCHAHFHAVSTNAACSSCFLLCCFQGLLASQYAALMRQLWSAKFTAVAPTAFKQALAKAAPRFAGRLQHDAQELLSVVLDQVHEDLNQSVTATADSDEQGKLAAQVLQGQVERCEAIVASAGDGATVTLCV